MHISSVYVLDGELDFKKFMTRFEKRIYLVPAYNDISQRTRCFINWLRNTGLSSKICCRGRAGIYQLTLPENSRITRSVVAWSMNFCGFDRSLNGYPDTCSRRGTCTGICRQPGEFGYLDLVHDEDDARFLSFFCCILADVR
jgi:hypothetical protein